MGNGRHERTPAQRSALPGTQCIAKSQRTGNQCRRWAVLGATTCLHHGAAAPQVQRKALERLRELQPDALAVIEEALESDDEKTRLSVAMDILDRTGIGRQSKVEQNTVSKIEDIPTELLRELAGLDKPEEKPN